MRQVSGIDLTPIKHQVENYNRLYINRSTLSRRIVNPRKSREKLDSSPSRMISTRKWPDTTGSYDHSRSYLQKGYIKDELNDNYNYKRITPKTARLPSYRQISPFSRHQTPTPPPVQLNL